MDPIQELDRQFHFPTYKRLPVTLVEGKGSRVWDTEGKEYVDFVSGIAVNALGHSHPSIKKALTSQLGKVIHLSNAYYNLPQVQLAELLARTTGYEKVFFCNSGLEANEAAIKLARRYASSTDKKGPILSFTNCFHGRSIAQIAMGGEKYRKGFGPFPDGYRILEFNHIESLEKNLDPNVPAVFIEVVQGEGGIIPAKKNFLVKLDQLCKKFGILIICDEIQTGLGRTGKFLAFEHFPFKPDVITLAKALGGGLPLGAVLTTEKYASLFQSGDHGSTFGGNPMACAASLAVIHTIRQKNLDKYAGRIGKYLLKNLRTQLADLKEILEIRGIGLMIGIELTFPCRIVVERMLKQGFLVNCTSERTIRLLPPLIIKKQDIDKMIPVLRTCIMEGPSV